MKHKFLYRTPKPELVRSIGRFEVWRAKLDREDYRSYVVVGPLNGRMAPLASCWNEPDAVNKAQDLLASNHDN